MAQSFPQTGPHAGPPPSAPLTEEAFLADRLRFWSAFTSFTVNAVIAIVVLLIGLALFVA